MPILVQLYHSCFCSIKNSGNSQQIETFLPQLTSWHRTVRYLTSAIIQGKYNWLPFLLIGCLIINGINLRKKLGAQRRT